MITHLAHSSKIKSLPSMSRFIFTSKQIIKGNSVSRAFLNYRLKEDTLKGKTIDIGSGGSGRCSELFKRADDVSFELFDLKVGDKVDFETDVLPADDDSYDTVVFMNVMEHIFNYQHIANEVVRINKPGGQVIGFVPFLMWYHPDHRDFFRYTHEALENIFNETGAKQVTIEPIAMGPFIAAAHMTVLSFPLVLRPVVYTLFYLMDMLYLALRRTTESRYALGYYFTIVK